MKNLKKFSLLLLVLMMLVPTYAFAKEMDLEAVKEEIKETIDYSDSELYGPKAMLRSAGNAADFAVYHRNKDKLSMADDAFDKERSSYKIEGDNYVFTFYTKPVSKVILGGTYWADCTELKFIINGQEVKAEPFGSTEAVNNKSKKVPEGFTFTISKDNLINAKAGSYDHYFKIKFETNLEDSGVLGKIGDKMMNRNARLFVR